MALAPGPENRLGFLHNCLVEGDTDREGRVRRGKQRALLISIVFQILIVAALILFPLLTRGERITVRGDFTPVPPYARGSTHPHKSVEQRTPRETRTACHFCAPRDIPRGIVTRDSSHEPPNPEDDTDDSDVARFGDRNGDPRGFLNSDSTRGPKPPDEQSSKENTIVARRPVSEPLQAAMLYHRVEPVYPPLAIQTRREGRVELHALISADGSIQSLEVISGDPLFIRSALEAVREWRYHPTILNGQPVEVDTHVTVVYTLNH